MLTWTFISLIFKLDKNYSILLVNNNIVPPVNIIGNRVQNSSLKNYRCVVSAHCIFKNLFETIVVIF